MERPRYQTIVEEFDTLLEYAKAVDAALTGRPTLEKRLAYAGEVFVKLLAHCVTLRELSPDPSNSKKVQLWDLGSLAAIARCVIETYDSLSYIAGLKASADERDFRLLLWSLHDSNRRMHMLECVGVFDQRFHDLGAKEQRLHEQVIGNAFFKHIPKSAQGKIVKREPPESYLSIRERCTASGVNYDYYTAATMHLSQFVHTFPFAVHQMFLFRAGSAEALLLMALPMEYAMSFLCKSLTDLQQMFPSELPEPPTDVKRKLTLWCTLVERGTRRIPG